MKKNTAFALASALGLLLSGRPIAAGSPETEPVMVKDQTTARSTVVAIDKAQRTVTLKGPQGNLMELIVDEGVTRFDALKVGDIVMAGDSESAKFEIQRPGTPVAPDSIVRGGGKITGERPGGAVAEGTARTVTITAIDAKAPTVTFKNSDGGTEVYHVRHPEYLDRFKVGDQVRVTRMKSLLVAVEAAK